MSEPALYAGTLSHRRTVPVERAFTLPLRRVWVDVDALPGALDGLPLWSARRPAPVWVRRADYGDGGRGPLGAFVRGLVAERTGAAPAGPVRMLTLPRTLGYVFNPLTVYCCGAPGTPQEKVVLEVTNTPWKERQLLRVCGPTLISVKAPLSIPIAAFSARADSRVRPRRTFSAGTAASSNFSPSPSASIRARVISA